MEGVWTGGVGPGGVGMGGVGMGGVGTGLWGNVMGRCMTEESRTGWDGLGTS